MNADQVIDGIGKAVAVSQTQEYCLLWSDYFWWMCMTKAEWSSWIQAVFTIAAIFVSVSITKIQLKRKDVELNKVEVKRYLNNLSICHELRKGAFSVCFELNENFKKLNKDNKKPISTERLYDLQETLKIVLSKDMDSVLLVQIFKLQKAMAKQMFVVNSLNVEINKNEYPFHDYYDAAHNFKTESKKILTDLRAMKRTFFELGVSEEYDHSDLLERR